MAEVPGHTETVDLPRWGLALRSSDTLPPAQRGHCPRKSGQSPSLASLCSFQIRKLWCLSRRVELERARARSSGPIDGTSDGFCKSWFPPCYSLSSLIYSLRMDNHPLQPLNNPKYRHVSRSAAKRESVQMLGSIQNLRLQFSQIGVSHKEGAGAGVRYDGSPGVMGLGMVGEDDEENRPLPREGQRERKERKPWKEVDLPRVEPEAARKEAQEIVTSIRQIWGLSVPASPASPHGLSTSKSLYFSSLAAVAGGEEERRTSDDIQSALVTTARSMRRVRFLALSVSQGQSSTPAIPSAPNSKLRTSFSTPSRPGVPLPRAVSSPLERRVFSSQKQGEDVLASLRKSALDVLTALRALEERLRIQVNVPEDDRILAPIDSQSSSIEPEYYESDYDSDDYNLNALAQVRDNGPSASLPWEERLVQESRSYRVLEGQEWEKEARMTREGVGKWVAVVEKLFLVGGKGEDVEKEMPEWAKDWRGDAFGMSVIGPEIIWEHCLP